VGANLVGANSPLGETSIIPFKQLLPPFSHFSSVLTNISLQETL